MIAFIDTNVVIDFCANRSPFFDDASMIIDMAYRGEIDIVISSLSFINVAYILRKAFPKKEVKLKLKELANVCHISPIDKDMIVKSIDKDVYDFEDSVQYLSGVSHGCDIIITRDVKGFSEFSLPVFTPNDFIKNCI